MNDKTTHETHHCWFNIDKKSAFYAMKILKTASIERFDWYFCMLWIVLYLKLQDIETSLTIVCFQFYDRS